MYELTWIYYSSRWFVDRCTANPLLATDEEVAVLIIEGATTVCDPSRGKLQEQTAFSWLRHTHVVNAPHKLRCCLFSRHVCTHGKWDIAHLKLGPYIFAILLGILGNWNVSGAWCRWVVGRAFEASSTDPSAVRCDCGTHTCVRHELWVVASDRRLEQ